MITRRRPGLVLFTCAILVATACSGTSQSSSTTSLPAATTESSSTPPAAVTSTSTSTEPAPETTTTSSAPATTTTVAPVASLVPTRQQNLAPRLTCSPPPSTDPSSAPVQLDMWSVLNQDAARTLEGQINDFNNSHDQIHINLSATGSSDEIIAKLATGERPDLLSIGSEALVNLTDAGLVTDAASCIAVDPTFDAEDLLPVAAASYRLRGEQVAVPLTVSTPVLFYNRVTFAAAGLDPDKPPRTLADLRSDLETLIGSGQVTTGLTYADASWFVTQWAAQLSVPLASSGNGHDVADGSGAALSLDDPKLLDALTQLQSMAAAGLIAKAASGGIADLLALVDDSNRAGMAFHTSGSVSVVYADTAQMSSSPASVGVAPLPGPGAGGTVGGSALWITTADQDKVWPTWTAIRFFTDAARQAQYGELGYAPARLSALDDTGLKTSWFAYPGLRVAFDQLVATTPVPAHLPIAIGTQTNLSWRLNWAGEDVADVSRNIDPSTALAHAQRDSGANLAVYNTMRYGAP